MKTAEILRECIREQDVLARTGGDEFAILMPDTDNDTACQILMKISKEIDHFNQATAEKTFVISISLGCGTKVAVNDALDHTIKTAEDFMYKRKLMDHKSSHSALIASIRTTLFERSQETEEHAERLSELSRRIGEALHLSQMELYELALLSTLHDIGKIGISDSILNKPGKLTEPEWEEMKRHSEIGYRIAMSSPELASIADYILCHHENWDGTGYPQALTGNNIPLLSRILAVVDAFDAMTHDRSYRKALSAAEARTEILRNAGTQFDPVIAGIFANKILKETVCRSDRLV